MAISKFGGEYPEIAASVYVADSAEIIGAVKIEEESSVWPLAVIRGDVNKIKIGRSSNIQDGCILHVNPDNEKKQDWQGLIVGNSVTVGHGAVLHGCRVGDFCLIGIRSIILDAALIQPYCVIGAGSFVPAGMVVEGGFVWAGNPIKKIRPISERERELLIVSARHYVELKDKYL